MQCLKNVHSIQQINTLHKHKNIILSINARSVSLIGNKYFFKYFAFKYDNLIITNCNGKFLIYILIFNYMLV